MRKRQRFIFESLGGKRKIMSGHGWKEMNDHFASLLGQICIKKTQI